LHRVLRIDTFAVGWKGPDVPPEHFAPLFFFCR
jgi:hypothetical protein